MYVRQQSSKEPLSKAGFEATIKVERINSSVKLNRYLTYTMHKQYRLLWAISSQNQELVNWKLWF